MLNNLPVRALVGARVSSLKDEGTKAIVRVGLLDIAKASRTMVYEDGEWLQEPSDELAENFGKPVAEWTC